MAQARSRNSHQQTASINRKRGSIPDHYNVSMLLPPQSKNFAAINEFQANNEEPMNNYTITNRGKMRRTSSGRRAPSSSSLFLQSPADYLNNNGNENCNSVPLAVPHVSRPAAPPVSRFSLVSPTLDPAFPSVFFPSPTTPTMTDLTTATTLSYEMSRENSRVGSLNGGMNMLRVQSQDSRRSGANTGTHHGSPGVVSSSSDECSDPFTFSEFTTRSSNPYNVMPNSMFYSPLVTQNLFHSYSISPIRDDNMMKRSISSESSEARASRRRQEQITQAERPIAPKTMTNAIFTNTRNPAIAANNTSLIQPQDRSPTGKYQISRVSNVRPEKPKLYCTLCDKHPKGFRGEHELNRHAKRSHEGNRIGFVCITASTDNTYYAECRIPLQKCKQCRKGKIYGAYYNAAAHLRRVHFHPKPKKRRANSGSSRAGNGGGDHPPMNDLKLYWMQEVNEENPLPTPPVSQQSNGNNPTDNDLEGDENDDNDESGNSDEDEDEFDDNTAMHYGLSAHQEQGEVNMSMATDTLEPTTIDHELPAGNGPQPSFGSPMGTAFDDTVFSLEGFEQYQYPHSLDDPFLDGQS